MRVRVVLLQRREQVRFQKHVKTTMGFWSMRCQRKRTMFIKVVEMMEASLIVIFVWILLENLLLLAVVIYFAGRAFTDGCIYILMLKNAPCVKERYRLKP
jgi:hypothetical protein